MSRRRPLLLRIARCLAATALLVVAGCTSSTADSLTGSSISESSAAVSPSVADVSTGPSSNGASERALVTLLWVPTSGFDVTCRALP